MMRPVVIAPVAAQGLRAARAWLMQPGSGAGGQRRWDNLRQTRRRLRDHPYLGQSMPEFPGCYGLLCEQHIIVYAIDPGTGDAATAGGIAILAIFGPGQDRKAP